MLSGGKEMIAYLLICHKNAAQVIRLVKRLKTGEADVFLHADLQMQDFAMLADFAAANQGIYLVEDRKHGQLDDSSLVDITMSCVESARETEAKEGKHYGYYLLLSGQDYPIRPVPWIERQLADSYPQPFIDCTPYSRSNWVGEKFDRNGPLIRYRNWILSHTKPGLARKAFQLSAVAARKWVFLMKRTTAQKMEKMGISLYGGSAWWILPDTVIAYIRAEYRGKTKIVKMLLEESVTPEETFFQTMAMLSPLGEKVKVNGPDMVGQNSKTLADFGGISKRPIQNHPYVLTVNELELFSKTDFWFARKFDAEIDETVLDRIDRRLDAGQQ